jgi:hypothetical protein
MDALNPSPQVLIKIGSLLVHYQEFNSSDGHYVDKAAIDSLEQDEDIQEWLRVMAEAALVPLKRKS